MCVCACVHLRSIAVVFLFSSSCCSCIFNLFRLLIVQDTFVSFGTYCICNSCRRDAAAEDCVISLRPRFDSCSPPLMVSLSSFYILFACSLLCLFLALKYNKMSKSKRKKCVHFFKRINDKVLCRRLFLLLLP